MIKAGRERPSNLEAKRQLLIDAARHNLEEEVDDLENLTSKGIAFDDAIAQTLTRWEITDQDRAQVGEGLAKAYQLVRELRASNKAEVERRYLEHCRAAAANAHRRAVERDEAEFCQRQWRISPVGTAKSIGTLKRQWLFRSARTRKS